MADWNKIVARVGDLARPFVLYASGGSSAIATVLIVAMRFDLVAGAAYIAAAWAGTAALYGAKALEERGKAKSEAEVAVARVHAEQQGA